jgi:hypothetical protein
MKHKKLVLVVPVFPQISETFIVSKFLGLLERGWDVHIVAQKLDPQAWAAYPQLQTPPQPGTGCTGPGLTGYTGWQPCYSCPGCSSAWSLLHAGHCGICNKVGRALAGTSYASSTWICP